MPSPDVEALLAQMTLDEKIGQMTQADKTALKDGEEVHELLHGLRAVRRRLAAQAERARDLGRDDRRLQSQALSTRLGIPILYGVDAVHGHGDVKGATIFPHNIGMGATRNPDARRGGGARDGARGRGHRRATGRSRPASRSRATSAGGAPTRATARSPELAELLGAGRRPRLSGAPAADGTRDPGLRQALPRRRRHRRRQGPGRHARQRRGAAQDPPARLRRRREGRRRQRDGLVLAAGTAQPMHGNKRAHHRRAEGRARVRGFVVTDWAGHRQDGAATTSRTSRSRSTPASTW